MFDWEHRIAQHAMEGNLASSPGEGDVSWDFSSCGRNLGYILELQRGWPLEIPLCSVKSGLLSSYYGHRRNLNWAWQHNTDASGGEVRDQVSLFSFHRDIGIPINFQEESGLIKFRSTELRRPLEVSRDVRPPVHMRRGTRFFSRVSTGDSDISSSCEMKDEPT